MCHEITVINAVKNCWFTVHIRPFCPCEGINDKVHILVEYFEVFRVVVNYTSVIEKCLAQPLNVVN